MQDCKEDKKGALMIKTVNLKHIFLGWIQDFREGGSRYGPPKGIP